jgi:zinc transport system substrate-binding protein
MNMILRSVTALILCGAALTACGGSGSAGSAPAAQGGRVDVAVGFYPYQYVTERVGGAGVAVTNLTKPGGEPHDLELTPQQVARLADTDLVVYSKGFQPAVDEAVEQQAGGRSLDVLTAVELQAAPEGGEARSGQDPHVWLDPVRLGTIALAVADRLAEVDPDGAQGYRDRAGALQSELGALDGQLREGLASCLRREIVTSHDAYGYLAGAYGLTQVPIAGLSPEDEASPGRLAQIAVESKEKGVTSIFFEELVSPKVAESLAREVGASAVVLSPLEGAPETGDYVTAMQANLSTLRSALGCT